MLDTKYKFIDLDLLLETENEKMIFSLSDNETSDFFIRVKRAGVELDLSSYNLTLWICKPNKITKSKVLQYDSNLNCIYCNLENELKNIEGAYVAQLVVEDPTTKESKFTRSRFTYIVKSDVLSEIDETIIEENENVLFDILKTLKEHSTQLDNIVNNFSSEQTDTEIVLKYRSTEILRIPITNNSDIDDPAPAIVIIVNNLTNCTNSNTSETVNKGDSYNANIVANNGYILSSVVVTMDSVDITSSCYNNGTIYIDNVTGSIVITAIAEINTDAIVGSIDSDNNIILTGLEAGTYSLKYEDNNENILDSYDNIATVEVV